MIDFLKWMVSEHPVLSFFSMLFPCWALHGLGRLGSTRVKVKRKDGAS